MSKIVEIYKKLSETLESNLKLRDDLFLELSKIVSNAYQQSIAKSDESYCFKFALPINPVLKLYDLLSLDKTEVGDAFQKDWSYPSSAMMYNDPYYHILLLLIYYGIKNDKKLITKHALTILLMKVWNGRKAKYLKYCDKRVMNYVVTHMVNNKHLISKYSTPMNLIDQYFIPTLSQKYFPEIDKNPQKLKQLFMQCWVRVNQLFVSNMRQNMVTGVKEAQSGILPLYMKAKQENLYMSTQVVSSTDEESESPRFDQYSTLHNRDEIVSSTTDYIVLNKPSYPTSVISDINKKTKVSIKIIEKMLNAMHNHKYHDLIHAIYVMVLARTNVNERNDICKTEFLLSVKKNIISSKNTSDIINFQKLLDSFVNKIFEEDLGLSYRSYSNVQQMQIRNVVLYGLIYDLRKHNCENVTDATIQ